MIALGLAVNSEFALVGEGCSPHKYVNATAFTDNLNSVLHYLLYKVSSNGFATSMQNKSGKTDPVYGLAVCRKYLNARECSECVQEAANQAARLVKAHCSKPNGVRIHLNGCFLRYENNSFYDEDVDAGNYNNCTSTIASDPEAFSLTAQNLSRQLIRNASANNGYAVGSIDGSLYGLAQCWVSLVTGSCETCLTAAQNQLLTCPPRIEGRGLEAGCFMRYSNYSFFPYNQTSCTSFLVLVQLFTV